MVRNSRGSSKRNQSVPVNPAERPNPEEKSVQCRDIGDLDTRIEYLYPENTVEVCPVPKVDHLETEQQQPYMRWIEKILDLDRRTTKDPRLHTESRFQMRHIDALCAQAVTLHFFAPVHRSMVAKAGPIGTSSRASTKSRMEGNQSINGERMSVTSMLMSILQQKVLNVQLSIHSLNVQQQQ